jgi:hypothetical protein
MSDITPRRIIIQQEETKYRASVSEATLSRVGATTNFINMKQYDSRGFFLNGAYRYAMGQTGVDGAWGILFDIEIVGIMMFNLVAGTSSLLGQQRTILDIRRWTASNTGNTSIFTDKPIINYTAPNNAYLFIDLLNSTTLENPTGTFLPTMAVTQLNAGDMLTMNCEEGMLGAQNCGLLIYYRPR